ncbi:MAG: MoxR family ATPase, partial [Verrucomicrobiota bacterium]
ATQNPIEQEGTYPLPEAQQDRFMMCLYLDYPERDPEIDIVLKTTDNSVPDVETVMNAPSIIECQQTVDEVPVSPEAAAYAVDLVRATRTGENTVSQEIKDVINWGAGPRAGQSLLRMAKALAAMDGRPAISRHDIAEVAVPVIRHRISCNYRARTEGLDEEKVIQRILEEMEI